MSANEVNDFVLYNLLQARPLKVYTRGILVYTSLVCSLHLCSSIQTAYLLSVFLFIFVLIYEGLYLQLQQTFNASDVSSSCLLFKLYIIVICALNKKVSFVSSYNYASFTGKKCTEYTCRHVVSNINTKNIGSRLPLEIQM